MTSRGPGQRCGSGTGLLSVSTRLRAACVTAQTIGFADLYATGQIPEYHEIVDTIVASGAQILAYHTSRRVSNGPLEGTNNLHQVLRRGRPRFRQL